MPVPLTGNMAPKMSHSVYWEYITQYLITTALDTATCTKKKPPIPVDNTKTRLTGKLALHL